MGGASGTVTRRYARRAVPSTRRHGPAPAWFDDDQVQLLKVQVDDMLMIAVTLETFMIMTLVSEY